MLFDYITEDQDKAITNVFLKHMYIMQKEIYRDTDLEMSRTHVLQGMIKLFT